MLTIGGTVLIMTVAVRGDNEAEFVARRAQLVERGATIDDVPGSESGSLSRLSLPAVLDRLGGREVNELWVEAGPRLAGALLRQALVDELMIYVAPKLLGPQARPLVEMGELRSLQEAPNFVVLESRQIGEDVRLRLRPRRQPAQQR